MEHTVKVVEQKEQNDEYVSFRLRCCDDESTDSWCSVSLHLTEEETSEAIIGHKTAIANSHEHKLNYRAGTHHAAVLAQKEHKITL